MERKNFRKLKRNNCQLYHGLSTSPLAGYNCLSNLCPRGDFARSISRGPSPVPETIDRCICITITQKGKAATNVKFDIYIKDDISRLYSVHKIFDFNISVEFQDIKFHQS